MDKKIVIIGGGPGGYVCALRAADLGAEVTLIEKEHLGGTCLNYGCIPSKVMKHSAASYLRLLDSEVFGIETNGKITINISRMLENKNKIIKGQRTGIGTLLKSRGVSTVFGHAEILSKEHVEVTDQDGSKKTVDFDRLVIATGTKPLNVKAFPFDHQRILSSDDLLSLTEVPFSMVIVGGGVIGCEFACIYSALGTQVTIIEAMSRLLPMPFVDDDISKLLLREMKKKKIKVICDTIVRSGVEKDGSIEVTLGPSPITDNQNPKALKETMIQAEKMAVCIGREPISEGIGLENIKVDLAPGGWIQVDEKMQTSVKNVYAIGDILGPEKIMLAHTASHEGLVAAENVMGKKSTMSYEVMPGAVFTGPEIGVVGLSESQAEQKGIESATASVNFRNLGKAHAIGEIAGMAKIVYDPFSGKIIGAHIIGAHATDLIAEAALAIRNGLTLKDVAHTVHAHPTLAEIWGEAAFKALGTPIHG